MNLVERKLAASLWFLSAWAFDAFSFLVSVPKLYRWYKLNKWSHLVDSGSGVCTCIVFLCYTYTPWADTHPAMNITVPSCHLLSQRQLPLQASLETHTSLSQDPSPMCLYLCSAGKPLKPRNPRTAGGNSWQMPQHRGAEQGCPLNEITGG